MVEENMARIPEQKKDDFWGIDKIAPLYSIESAERTVHPLVGSASSVKWVAAPSFYLQNMVRSFYRDAL